MEEKKKRFRPTVVVLLAVPLLLILLIAGLMNQPEPLLLRLKSEQAFLRCGEEFEALKYVGDYSEDAQLELPECFIADLPETRIVRYRLTRGNESLEKILRVSIRDESAPELKLKNDRILLKSGEVFDYRSFIDYANDKVDGDLRSFVHCDYEDDGEAFEALYYVEDQSGNRMEATLFVEREPQSEQMEQLEQVLEELQNG